jgi:hypothetical protein
VAPVPTASVIAGIEGAEAERPLHVQGLEEPEAEDRRVEKEDRQVRGPQGSEAEDAKRHQRLAGDVALVHAERDEEHRPCGKRRENAGRPPAQRVGGDDPIRQRGHAQGHEHGPEHVEVTVRPLAAALRHEVLAGQHNREPDRDVDEEDRRPAEAVRQEAAEQDARGRPDRSDGAPDAQGAVTRCPFVKRGRDDRKRRRGDDRPADALDRPCRQEHPGRLRDGAEERCGGEDDCPGEEHPSPAEEVGGSPAQQQEAGEGQRVRVQDPLESDAREAELVFDRREGDVHDRDVEDHHELAQADDQEQRIRIAPHDVPPGRDRVHRPTAASM